MAKAHRRHWRDYKTPAGGRPVKEYLAQLEDDEVAEILAGMDEVTEEGLSAARHLGGPLYEVRADATNRSFRLLFAAEGHFSHVLLSLSIFEKRTQKTPLREIELAQKRLALWRSKKKNTAR